MGLRLQLNQRHLAAFVLYSCISSVYLTSLSCGPGEGFVSRSASVGAANSAAAALPIDLRSEVTPESIDQPLSDSGVMGLRDEVFVQVTERAAPVVVRKQPDASSAELDQLVYGDRMVVAGVVAGTVASGAPRWLKIRTGAGESGYIASFLTNYSPVLGCLVTVDASSGANLRQAPNLLSTVMRTLSQGQKVRLMGEMFTDGDSQLNRWLRVRTGDDQHGFVSAQLTSYMGHLRNDTQPQGGECPFAAERIWEAHGDQKLIDGVNAALAKASGSGTQWSVELRYLAPNGKRRVLFQQNPSRPLRPASNMKLLTGYLELLKHGGTDYASRMNFPDFVEMMKYSVNSAADRLAREALDARADSELNVRAAQRLKDEGFEPGSGFAMRDGSGLSYENRLSARLLVQILRGALQDPFFHVFESALPVAGQDGTLASRSVEGFKELRAKTGTLIQNPATALSGYARCSDGTGGSGLLIFSFLGDGVTAADQGHGAIDDALRAVARHLKTWRG
jgi:hypothetical protein